MRDKDSDVPTNNESCVSANHPSVCNIVLNIILLFSCQTTENELLVRTIGTSQEEVSTLEPKQYSRVGESMHP